MTHILDPQSTALADWLASQNAPKFRHRQILSGIIQRRATSFQDITDLPQSLREQLASEFTIWTTRIARHSEADDGTEKLLLQLQDGGQIECVLIREADRRTICISSQVGCAMGCVFCASGLDGVDRNLTSGEIVEQMLRLQALLPPDERLSNIVVMGMGEPLANLDHLLPALDVASADSGLGISRRRVTISTVGLPPAIDRLIRLNCRYSLAVSLHAANDELRNRLVPVNNKIGLQAIMEAADRYFEQSGRRLTYEYVLLAGINDSDDDARQMARLLKGRPALLNVIPYNPVAGLPYRTPSNERIDRFRKILEQAGIIIRFRQRKGNKIDAACGQLRRITNVAQLSTIVPQPT